MQDGGLSICRRAPHESRAARRGRAAEHSQVVAARRIAGHIKNPQVAATLVRDIAIVPTREAHVVAVMKGMLPKIGTRKRGAPYIPAATRIGNEKKAIPDPHRGTHRQRLLVSIHHRQAGKLQRRRVLGRGQPHLPGAAAPIPFPIRSEHLKRRAAEQKYGRVARGPVGERVRRAEVQRDGLPARQARTRRLNKPRAKQPR
jgi:hypothetical protein